MYSTVQESKNATQKPKISLEQRERIARAFEDVHEDYLAIAETIGVNRSTARGIVSRYVREGSNISNTRDSVSSAIQTP